MSVLLGRPIMAPRPYSGRSVLPSDSSNSSTSVESDTAQITVDTSPGSLSTTTTPSPTSHSDALWDAAEIHDEVVEIDAAANVPFYPTPADSMPFDHALPVFLRVLTNERNLANVQTLKLRVISDLVSLQRISLYTMNLRELDLEGSLLYSLRYIGCNLKQLRVLKVGNCRLDSLDGTFGLTSLRQLYAQRNLITDVSPCSNLPHIQHIDVSGNRIRNVAYAGFLSVCRKLKSMVIAGNPAAQLSDYRGHVKRILPQLDSLDGISFSNAENSSPEKKRAESETSDCDDETLEDFDNDFFNNSHDSSPSSADSSKGDHAKDAGRSVKDFHLLSLRKERDEGRHFKAANRNVNFEETEDLGESCSPSTSSRGGDGGVTLPRLHLCDHKAREGFHLGAGPRPEVKKVKTAVDRSGERSSSISAADDELLDSDTEHSQKATTGKAVEEEGEEQEEEEEGAGPRGRTARPEASSATTSREADAACAASRRRRSRPSTAGPPIPSYEPEDKASAKVAHRSLTSGLPMCGNVALALRNRRKQEQEKEDAEIVEAGA